MTIKVLVIHAFSIEGKGGNPAGVVLNADHLSTSQKQQIAAKAGFPETAFVSASSVADFKLDFFTPTKQIPHCGHATIATFSYLKSLGRIQGDRSSKETIDGCRTILFKNGQAFMEQKAPSFPAFTETEALLRSLNIREEALLPGFAPAIVNTGNSFLVVPVKDEATLAAIDYDRNAVYKISEAYGLIGYYLYTHTAGFDATTRMFGPFYGIDEEAGTGMAAGTLAAYLHKEEQSKNTRFRIEQGKFMQPASASLIEAEVEVSEGEVQRIFAGGGAHVEREVTAYLDETVTAGQPL